jgi:peptidoglycan/LPS O-acetylase OafA/YrhL
MEVMAEDGGGARGELWTLGRRPALDGVRALALVLVVAAHALFLWSGDPVIGGGEAVTIFFVLSGFLITSLLLEEHEVNRRISIGSFYRRRALRLLPTLFAMLAVAFVLSRLIYSVRVGYPMWRALATTGTAFGGFYDMTLSSFSWASGWGIDQIWSLSVEEQFYFLWPLVLVLLLRWQPKWVGVATLSFAVEAWALGVLADVVKHNVWYAYFSTPTNFSGLMLGSFVAWKMHTGWRPRWTTPATLVALVFFGWVALRIHTTSASWFVWANPLVALGAAALVLSVLDERSPFGRLFSLRPFRYAGRISYSVYVWHYLILTLIVALLPVACAAEKLLIFCLATVVVSVASFKFIEAPSIQSAKRFSPRRSRSVVGKVERAIEPCFVDTGPPVLVGAGAE